MEKANLSMHPTRKDPFDIVRTLGLSLPDVEAATRYDGAPVLRLGGCFMASSATHPSAEPDTLVVRMGFDECELLLEDAPETYYVTDSYRRHPLCWCDCRTSGVTRFVTCCPSPGG